MIHLLLRIATAACLLSCLLAAEKVSFTKAPDWALKTPEFTKEASDKDGSRRFHLADLQYNAETQELHQHLVVSILNESGVEDFAQIDIGFQPEYQDLQLHHITVERNGVTVDKLKDAKIETLRREEDLERRLYDGQVTALIILKDIQPGDVLSYAFTIRGENPVYDGRSNRFLRLGYASPIDMLRRAVLWDKQQRTMQWKIIGETPTKPELEESESLSALVWQQKDAPTIHPEDNTPGWHYDFPYLQVTDFKDWEEFGQWALPLYENKDQLPPDIKKLCQTIRDSHDTDEERIVAVLDWVKSNIRYLGSFIGEHTHRPHELSLICKRRFGDCKDKGLLTIAMLRELGYDAAPALVHTVETKAIAGLLPGSVFDHLIVHLKHDGNDYFLDATHTYQRGRLKSLSVPDYGFAFIVRDQANELSPVAPRGMKEDKVQVRESYTVHDDYQSADLEVITIATGGEADSLRSYFARNSHEKIGKTYLEFYEEDFEDVESTKPLSFVDDEVENRIEIREHYHLPSFWEEDEDDGAKYGYLTASYMMSRLSFPDENSRTKPMPHAYPLNIEHTIETRMPKKWPMEGDSVTIEHPSFIYRSFIRQKNKGFILRHSFRSLSNEIDPKNYKSFTESMSEVEDDLYWHVSHGTEADISSTEDPNVSTAMFLTGSTMLGLLCGIAVAFALWFWDPAPRPHQFASAPGLGGWMIFPTIGAITLPLFFLYGIASYITDVAGITESLEIAEHPGMWRLYYFICQLQNAFLFGLAILQLLLLFTKRTSFPYYFILLAVIMLITDLLIILVEVNLEDSDQPVDYSNMIASTIKCFLWGSYMMLSERVKATFTNRRKANARPTPPPLPPRPTQPA